MNCIENLILFVIVILNVNNFTEVQTWKGKKMLFCLCKLFFLRQKITFFLFHLWKIKFKTFSSTHVWNGGCAEFKVMITMMICRWNSGQKRRQAVLETEVGSSAFWCIIFNLIESVILSEGSNRMCKKASNTYVPHTHAHTHSHTHTSVEVGAFNHYLHLSSHHLLLLLS